MGKRHTISATETNRQDSEAYWLGRWFTAARREGFLARLSPEAWHALSAVLSFTCRDGRRTFTADQLATALGQPRDTALQRLADLTQTDWGGQPLITAEYDTAGELAGAVIAPIESLAAVVPAEASDFAVSAPDDLVQQLEAIGLNPLQIDRLVRGFPEERIRRQLEWLPSRQARNPAALFLRAVEQDWEAPKEAS